MTLENSKRLWKHFMGTVKPDGFTPKPVQKIEADRMADHARIYYNVDGSLKSPGQLKENGPGFDVTGKPKEETKSKVKK